MHGMSEKIVLPPAPHLKVNHALDAMEFVSVSAYRSSDQ